MKIEPVPKVTPSFPALAKADSAYVWAALVPRLLHPIKLVVVEALLWVGEPMSATGLAAMLDDPDYYGGLISYHLSEMAKAGVVEVVGSRPARGAEELFFYFTAEEGGGDRSAPGRSGAAR